MCTVQETCEELWVLMTARDALDEAESVVAPLCNMLASTSGRDKAGRFVQYLCHLIRGLMVALDGKAIASRTTLFQKLRTLQFDISNARRAFRFYELGPLLTLTRLPRILEDEPFWVSRLLSSVCIAGFNLADRARWLQEHRLLPGNPSLAALHAARLLSLAMAATTYRLLRKATSTKEARRLLVAARARLRPNVELSSTSEIAGPAAADGLRCDEKEQQRPSDTVVDDVMSFRRDLYDAAKSLLNCWQAGHIGKLPGFTMGDVSMGMIGSLISASDLRDVWISSRVQRSTR